MNLYFFLELLHFNYSVNVRGKTQIPKRWDRNTICDHRFFHIYTPYLILFLFIHAANALAFLT
jgi:hypothetical protein